MSKLRFVLLSILLTTICSCDKKEIKNPLAAALSSENVAIKRVMDTLEQHEVQIRFTQIKREGDSVAFKNHDFQLAKNQYFYPASTVKFPIAVLTLEKLNEIDSLSMHTRFYVEGDSVETTFADEITKIFAVSDNQSYNRLFEFLGQNKIHQKLQERGLETIRISHRLASDNANDVTTQPLIIYLNDSTTATLSGSINTPPKPLILEKIEKGTGYLKDDEFIAEPFDFSLKNYYPIEAQHEVLKRIIFPESYPSDSQFNLSDAQRQFILKAMHTLPKVQGYNEEEYYDSYVKFFMYGDTKEPIPEHIKIYNKVGYAYGTLTDCAYIIDEENGIEFLISATILVNKDGVFNDDAYEYEEIGIPFLAALGREVYQQLLATK